MERRPGSEQTEPPQLPDAPRRLRFSASQILGVLLLFAIPVAAAFGVFGESRSSSSTRSQLLDLRVEHPARMRYGLSNRLDLYIRNLSGRPLDSLVVRIDDSDLSGFSDVFYTPAARAPGEIVLSEVGIGEERTASVEFQADRYWTQEGRIRVEADGRPELGLRLSTFVFP